MVFQFVVVFWYIYKAKTNVDDKKSINLGLAFILWNK